MQRGMLRKLLQLASWLQAARRVAVSMCIHNFHLAMLVPVPPLVAASRDAFLTGTTYSADDETQTRLGAQA